MVVSFRETTKDDEVRWRELWDEYTRFYNREPREEITTNTWARILDPNSLVHSFVAESIDKQIVGIGNFILHENTSTINPVCYLQDLIVDPSFRSLSVGEQMLAWLRDQLQVKGWSLIYWNTFETNYRARGLYDKFTPHSGALKYILRNPQTGGI